MTRSRGRTRRCRISRRGAGGEVKGRAGRVIEGTRGGGAGRREQK